MTLEALSDSTLSEQYEPLDASLSIWRGRNIEQLPFDAEAARLYNAAFAHFDPLRSSLNEPPILWQQICVLNAHEDDDFETDASFILLPDPALKGLDDQQDEDPSNPLILQVGWGGRVAKSFRNTGRKIKKTVRHSVRKINEFVQKYGSGRAEFTIASIPLYQVPTPSAPRFTRSSSPTSEEIPCVIQKEPSKEKPDQTAPPSPPESILEKGLLHQLQPLEIDPSLLKSSSLELIPLQPLSIDRQLDALARTPPLIPNHPHHPIDPVKPIPSSHPPLESNIPQPPLANRFLPTWKPKLPDYHEPSLTYAKPPFASSPMPPASLVNPSVGKMESPSKTAPSYPPVGFVDPDGPIRVYSHTEPPPRSSSFEIAGNQLARGCIGGINGMGNSLKEAQANARYLSELCRNHHLVWTHNCSHTIPVDLAEVFLLNYQGFSSPAKLLKEQWLKFHEKHQNDPHAKYLQYCHSQGALHVKIALESLPKEVQDRIIVVAIAPATVVPKNLCFASFNYASKNDLVPYGEIVLHTGLRASVEKLAHVHEALKELIILEPHPDAPLFDHDFKSPTFKERILYHAEEHVRQYGTVE